MITTGQRQPYRDAFDIDPNDWDSSMWEYVMFEGRRTDDGERFRYHSTFGVNRALTRRPKPDISYTESYE